MSSTFAEKVDKAQRQFNSLLSVGLDPHMDKLPQRFLKEELPQFAFNQWIVTETKEFASVFKLQFAAYEARGSAGWRELEMTVEWLKRECPDQVLIADAKRGDIGSTSEEYAKAIFDHLGFDAVTLQPYLGKEALEPFLSREDKGCIILCRTSNPGAGEFQDLSVGMYVPLWEQVATNVAEEWNALGNCALVVGATYPEELGQVRQIVGEMPILVPGIGAQGGDLAAVMKVGLNKDKAGLMIHASRSVIFADKPREEARKLREEINEGR